MAGKNQPNFAAFGKAPAGKKAATPTKQVANKKTGAQSAVAKKGAAKKVTAPKKGAAKKVARGPKAAPNSSGGKVGY